LHLQDIWARLRERLHLGGHENARNGETPRKQEIVDPSIHGASQSNDVKLDLHLLDMPTILVASIARRPPCANHLAVDVYHWLLTPRLWNTQIKLLLCNDALGIGHKLQLQLQGEVFSRQKEGLTEEGADQITRNLQKLAPTRFYVQMILSVKVCGSPASSFQLVLNGSHSVPQELMVHVAHARGLLHIGQKGAVSQGSVAIKNDARRPQKLQACERSSVSHCIVDILIVGKHRIVYKLEFDFDGSWVYEAACRQREPHEA
jgi:hypothetical protein